MPTTQKLQQKQTKATQKVGGSAKKPVTKVVGGGKVAPSKGKMTRGGSAKGGGIKIYQETKERSEDNRKLIMHLYKLIGSLVTALNDDKLDTQAFKNTNDPRILDILEKPYLFRVEKYQKTGETLSPDSHDPNSLENLISKDLDNTEFIRSIKRIYIGKPFEPKTLQLLRAGTEYKN